jgi:lipid-binding SYLF domain-containing protein
MIFIRTSLSLLIIIMAASMPLAQNSKETNRIQYSIDILKDMASIPDKTIPQRLLKDAYGIAIIPGVLKGAIGIGGRWGLGIITVHSDTGWSDPSFISVTGGSAGLQLGAQSSDFVLVFRTARSIENLKKGNFTFGGDISITAGPVGRNAEASTDVQLKSEIYSYARSRGLFVGASLEGTSMRIDHKANTRFYGSTVSVTDIFEGKVKKTSPILTELNKTLDEISGKKPLAESDSTEGQ